LYGLFAGVPGYIVECVCAVSGQLSPSSLSSFLSDLRSRIRTEILAKSAKERSLSEIQFAKILQRSFYTSDWIRNLQDTGLCGSNPPPALLLVFILEWISDYYDPDDLDSQINRARKLQSNVGPNDQGFVGCLFEYELVLRLKKNTPFAFAQFDLNTTWKRGPNITLSGTNWTKIFFYDGEKLEELKYVYFLF